MAFRFSLQKVVDLKTSQKSQAEWMLSRALARQREEEEALLELERSAGSLREQLGRSVQQKAPAGELAEMGRYLRHLDELIARKTVDLEQARLQTEQSRQHLTDRAKDEKVWQKARERAFDQYRSFMLKKEQQEIDEIASTRTGTN